MDLASVAIGIKVFTISNCFVLSCLLGLVMAKRARKSPRKAMKATSKSSRRKLFAAFPGATRLRKAVPAMKAGKYKVALG